MDLHLEFIDCYPSRYKTCPMRILIKIQIAIYYSLLHVHYHRMKCFSKMRVFNYAARDYVKLYSRLVSIIQVIDMLLFKGMEELKNCVDHSKQRHHLVGKYVVGNQGLVQDLGHKDQGSSNFLKNFYSSNYFQIIFLNFAATLV